MMAKFLRWVGVILIILAFLVPVVYQFFEEEPHFISKETTDFLGMKPDIKFVEREQIRHTKLLLWIYFLPGSFLLGIFWLTMAEILDKLENLIPNKTDEQKSQEKKLPELRG